MQEILHEWQNFYVVTGGAAAALIGLMFVAISLGSHLITPENMENIRTYVSPTLFHFVAVFVTACIMLVPIHSIASLAIVAGLLSLVGLWQALGVSRRMKSQMSNGVTEKNHWLWHSVLPTLSYVAGCAAAIGIAVSALPDWLTGFAFMSATLIVCAIHNIYVLVLWVVRQ